MAPCLLIAPSSNRRDAVSRNMSSDRPKTVLRPEVVSRLRPILAASNAVVMVLVVEGLLDAGADRRPFGHTFLDTGALGAPSPSLACRPRHTAAGSVRPRRPFRRRLTSVPSPTAKTRPPQPDTPPKSLPSEAPLLNTSKRTPPAAERDTVRP